MPSRTKIEWCDYTINPIIGCMHGCPYCYAKRMNDRFHFVKKWDEPEYQNGWDKKVVAIKKPSVIFVGSMTDLFGAWVTKEGIKDILEYCGKLKHKFLFLTKNPMRYLDFDFPANCWRGATITGKKDIANVALVDFVSVEPLMDDLGKYHFGNIKWMIVGGMTPKPCHKKECVDNLVAWAGRFGVPIFLKNNLHYPKIIQQFPKELRRANAERV
jgi:protein gp37